MLLNPLMPFCPGSDRKFPRKLRVYEITASEIPTTGDGEFRIIQSAATGISDVQISPDIGTCNDCLKELFDPSDRRYKYPFINCTNCGPRLTIIKDIPYDRERTSMSVFPLCAQCAQEYEDPADRRFHAEPNACPVCGPGLTLLDDKGKMVQAENVLAEAIKRIKAGSILAIKGLGGFHLCVDAANDEAVQAAEGPEIPGRKAACHYGERHQTGRGRCICIRRGEGACSCLRPGLSYCSRPGRIHPSPAWWRLI